MFSEDTDKDMAVHLQMDGGKSQSYWLKYNSKNSFIRVVSDGRGTVQEGSSVQVTGS